MTVSDRLYQLQKLAVAICSLYVCQGWRELGAVNHYGGSVCIGSGPMVWLWAPGAGRHGIKCAVAEGPVAGCLRRGI